MQVSFLGTHTTTNVTDMQALAARIVEEMPNGGVLQLIGGLGAGKTTFTKGLAVALGIREEVSSPTFTIIGEYDVAFKNISKLVHADLYRLSPEEVAQDPLIRELVAKSKDPGTLTVIEWADRLPNPIEGAYTLKFDLVNKTEEGRVVIIGQE